MVCLSTYKHASSGTGFTCGNDAFCLVDTGQLAPMFAAACQPTTGGWATALLANELTMRNENSVAEVTARVTVEQKRSARVRQNTFG